ncbi:MAG TPA: FtsQ-type POTRA domain-containing protein [Candidatus Mucispirillum faecigallinarum]|uniref:FtsQ-type POTRA domain-containing protein n=1 Tax=Candidatus Mucispirillum faecigallinarum TaxID=2838699 RepID=A0A9D2KDD9_9BACT|nr:FtsQ-type POTRA domain-containing protein [Candidatus Mucispirillum faecigallinarum]
MKGGIIKLVFLSVIVFGVGFGAATVVNKIKQTKVFTIKSVEVQGVINADRQAIQKIGAQFIGLNLFDSRLKETIVSVDPWVQRIIASKVLPDKIKLIVYEEKALFPFKNKQNKCFVFTGSGKEMAFNCNNVNIKAETKIHFDNAMKFAVILENMPELKTRQITLKDYSFEVVMDNNEVLICPYDYELLQSNYAMYENTIKERYKKIEYADLTVNNRIYVKGVLHAS